MTSLIIINIENGFSRGMAFLKTIPKEIQWSRDGTNNAWRENTQCCFI